MAAPVTCAVSAGPTIAFNIEAGSAGPFAGPVMTLVIVVTVVVMVGLTTSPAVVVEELVALLRVPSPASANPSAWPAREMVSLALTAAAPVVFWASIGVVGVHAPAALNTRRPSSPPAVRPTLHSGLIIRSLPGGRSVRSRPESNTRARRRASREHPPVQPGNRPKSLVFAAIRAMLVRSEDALA